MLPPHIYATAGLAAKSALLVRAADRKNQSVIISGESGAGKTETAKEVLHFLAEVCGGSQSDIEHKLVTVGEILESFGNAKTERNDNSSRFGKYSVRWMPVCSLPATESWCD